MDIFAPLEKLINEHGSSTIQKERVAFIKERYEAMEGQLKDAQVEIGKLQAQLGREQSDHRKTGEDLRALKAEHEEEIRIESGMEFRRGKRTGGRWQAFCPNCHGPVVPRGTAVYCPVKDCFWNITGGQFLIDQALGKLQ